MSDDREAVDLELALAALRGNYQRLAPRIRTLTHSVTCNLPGVRLRVHYPAFKAGKPTDHDLTRAISHYVTVFALHRPVRARAYRACEGLSNDELTVIHSELRDKAVSTFIKAQKMANKNGEAGELMLFILTEWILGAPQIIAKMSLKSDRNIAVHGADGIHVAFDQNSGSLKFYFGESKVYKSLPRALVSSVKSIGHALSDNEVDYEMKLVERHIDVSGLNGLAREQLLLYLDPFKEEFNFRKEVVTSFVAFDYEGYAQLAGLDPDARELRFVATLQTELATIAPKIAKLLSSAGIAQEEIEIFLMPLPSVAALREWFQAHIGWGDD